MKEATRMMVAVAAIVIMWGGLTQSLAATSNGEQESSGRRCVVLLPLGL
jgi:hypothetical protein